MSELATSFIDIVKEFWHILFIFIYAALAMWCTLHVMLNKKNTRSALAWIGVVWLSPVFGPLLYYIFGINRTNRKMIKLNKKEYDLSQLKGFHVAVSPEDCATPELSRRPEMFEVGENLNLSPFFEDTIVTPYFDCDEAFEEMLASIEGAEASVSLLSYIFDDDEVGQRFISALSSAQQRGVEVRVLIDHVGSISLRQNVVSKLKELGVNAESFLPIPSLIRGPYANLRNHRKLLIVDGKVAYTGGMNISARHLKKFGEESVRDTHFKLTGHVIRPLQRVFVDDWAFTTDEELTGTKWLPSLNTKITHCASRVIPDAPGEEAERVIFQFKYAIESAKNKIRILNPYFLPTSTLISSLKSAALRGVKVEIITPQKLDHQLIHYAQMGSIKDMMQVGIKFYFSAPPFNHSKILLVDDDYVNIGSSNWDSRSLHLNFELNVEILSGTFSKLMVEKFEEEKLNSKYLSLDEYKKRSKMKKIRDRFVRLFSPYL